MRYTVVEPRETDFARALAWVDVTAGSFSGVEAEGQNEMIDI